jgi:hypothetical protein
LESYVVAARDSTEPVSRFLAWREAASFGRESFVEQLRESLSQMDADQVRELESHGLPGRELRATVEMLRKSDTNG